MIEAVQNNIEGVQNSKMDEEIKKDVDAKIHKKLSTIFVVVGIISFTLGAIVNWYTIQRIKSGKR
jgi:hypothetical protein